MDRLDTYKTCRKCKTVKVVTDFHKDLSRSDKVRPECKNCRKKYLAAYRARTRSNTNIASRNWRKSNSGSARNSQLKYRYGIDLVIYNQLLVKQDHKCAICKSSSTLRSNTSNLIVDHDHTTGKVRGLLCDLCNKGIAHFRDKPEFLNSAAKYLTLN